MSEENKNDRGFMVYLLAVLAAQLEEERQSSSRLNAELNKRIAASKIEQPVADETEWPKPPRQTRNDYRFGGGYRDYPPSLFGW